MCRVDGGWINSSLLRMGKEINREYDGNDGELEVHWTVDKRCNVDIGIR